MSRRLRTATRIGAFAALALLLSGCIKLNMNLGINDDNTVSGTIQFGVDKQLLELSGQNAEDLLGGDSPFPSNAPGVTVKPFDDGEFAGQEFTFEAVPLEEFNSGGFAGATGLSGVSGVTGSSDALNIQRQGDTFVVTGALDLSSGLSGATGPFAGSGGADLFKTAEIKLAFTFPGAVQSAPGGQIDGNTVTYTPKFGERLEINATGSAVDNGQAQDVTGGGGGSNLLLYIIIGAAVVVLLVVLFLVLRGRNKGKGAGPDSGFGEGEGAAVTAPPAMAAPEGTTAPAGAPPSTSPPPSAVPPPSATPPPAPPPPPPPTTEG
jgi:phosphatidylinositol mannoside-binding LppM-like protein